MNVLHIMPYCPVPPTFGGALRVFHLLHNLVRNHDVTVLSYGSDDDRRRLMSAFDGRIKAVHMLPPLWLLRFRRLSQLYAVCTNQSFFRLLTHRETMQEKINRVLDKEHFDIVQTEFPMMAMFDLPTDAIKIMDAHNVEYDNFRRMYKNVRSVVRRAHYYREYRMLLQEELEACRKQDALFVTSLRDQRLFDRHLPDLTKFVVPNGVDTSYFYPAEITSEPHAMAFTGMMGYVPNYDGMLYFLDKIFPLILRHVADAKVYIVGNSPPEELLKRRSHNVVVTGYVDDVRPYVHRAGVYVVPLRMGGGTRLKVLEAMAMKKPIVTTSVGCEGIEISDGENAFVEDDPKGFADRVVGLFRSSRQREELAGRGYEFVRGRYDWAVVGARANEAYQKLLRPCRTPAPKFSRELQEVSASEV